MCLKTEDFDFFLPEELIAQVPSEKRDESRLMIVDPQTSKIENKNFYHIYDELQAGDLLVLNNTKVIPARLIGRKASTNISCEVLLLKRLDDKHWECLCKPGRRLKEKTEIVFMEKPYLACTVEKILEDGKRLIKFAYEGIFEELLDQAGKMPLPPYIHKRLTDASRYQTVYAKYDGSAAAPTAGLHFTPELLEKLAAKGVEISYVTLHVGLGTFRPVKSEKLEDHIMHSEEYSISLEAAFKINKALAEKRRIIAVGTTTTRLLESACFKMPDGNFKVEAKKGESSIFIYPGKQTHIVDALITNFHLPKSTLLMLVSAFAGRENILAFYRKAVEEKYRFFSFGDAMFIKSNRSKV